MGQTIELSMLQLESEPAVALVTRLLTQSGLKVVPSFNLQVARAAHTPCICPHHGTQLCDCQMIVALVYATEQPGWESGMPATLVIHGYGGRTYLSLVDEPHQGLPPGLLSQIRQALAPSKLKL